jgi:hypothetical protein
LISKVFSNDGSISDDDSGRDLKSPPENNYAEMHASTSPTTQGEEELLPGDEINTKPLRAILKVLVPCIEVIQEATIFPMLSQPPQKFCQNTIQLLPRTGRAHRRL